MRSQITIEDKELVIRVPLYVESFNPYDDIKYLNENIIGLIEPVANCSDPDCGFAYRINMSYAGKPDQWTDFFYKYFGNIKNFKKLCEKLKIEIYEYEQCIFCHGPIYGCYTFRPEGPMCHSCEIKAGKGAGA